MLLKKILRIMFTYILYAATKKDRGFGQHFSFINSTSEIVPLSHFTSFVFSFYIYRIFLQHYDIFLQFVMSSLVKLPCMSRGGI